MGRLHITAGEESFSCRHLELEVVGGICPPIWWSELRENLGRGLCMIRIILDVQYRFAMKFSYGLTDIILPVSPANNIQLIIKTTTYTTIEKNLGISRAKKWCSDTQIITVKHLRKCSGPGTRVNVYKCSVNGQPLGECGAGGRRSRLGAPRQVA
ncbi:hypothetical protein EVAR_6736_1 [Eumeta japonica]|uniref:Uncharacterized protein n=1 Tax=Eumeta variegata TaxID=151549 RepID=A0A4C1V3K8_EUMVA|nr:hypothetical protein EVAR_6736_1 [Eumeta japonica]